MGKQNFLKGLLTGMIGSSIFIGTISTVDAFEPYYKNIKAYVTSMNIFVNGKEAVLQSEPLLINDKIYLPLRDVAEVLGKEVKYDGANSSIYIDQKKQTYQPSTGLYQLEPVYGETYLQVGYGGDDYLEPEEDGGKISLYKQRFSTINSIAFLDGGAVAFNLYDNKFHTIRGFVGVDDSNPSYTEKGIVTFYGDGKELTTITTGTKREEPIAFEVDITGIEKLEIKSIKASGSASRVALVDVVLETVQE